MNLKTIKIQHVTFIDPKPYSFHFAFDPQCDDPGEGATLTCIEKDGERIAPSSYKGEIPWREANVKLGLWE